MPDVIVIGGGITGLAAAYSIAKRGRTVQVFEASGRLGGLIRTERVDGFTIEAGPDALLAQKPIALTFCDELGLTPRLMPMSPPHRAFVLRGGRLFPMPRPSVLGLPLTWRALAGYSLLPWSARLRIAAEPLVPARRDAADESIASFFRRRFGTASIDLIAQPLLGGIHAGYIDRLSVTSLFPRLVDAERQHGSVIRGLRASMSAGGAARPEAATASSTPFVSLRGGMDEMVTALASRLPADSVHANARVDGLRSNGARWHVTGPGIDTTARAAIIAAPASAAARLIAGVDRDASALCAEVPYVSTVSVALAWPRDAITHPLDGSGFVVARQANPNVRITACTWVSSKWESRAPAGSALLRAFLGGAHDPGAVDLSDEELTAIVLRDLGPVLGVTAAPSLVRVFRWRGAGAQHEVGQIARMTALEQRLAAHPGLFVAGSGFRATGIPDCIGDALAAAAAATDFCGHR